MSPLPPQASADWTASLPSLYSPHLLGSAPAFCSSFPGSPLPSTPVSCTCSDLSFPSFPYLLCYSPQVFTHEVMLLLTRNILPGLETSNFSPASDGQARGDRTIHIQGAWIFLSPSPLDSSALNPTLRPLPSPLTTRVPLSSQPEWNTIVCKR